MFTRPNTSSIDTLTKLDGVLKISGIGKMASVDRTGSGPTFAAPAPDAPACESLAAPAPASVGGVGSPRTTASADVESATKSRSVTGPGRTTSLRVLAVASLNCAGSRLTNVTVALPSWRTKA